MKKHFYFLISAILALLFSFSACGGGGDNDVSVTGVTLNVTATSIMAGKTEQLTATVQPTNATNQNVSWKSDAANIATVSDSGLVSAVTTGNARITVAAWNGEFTETCAVIVTAPPATGVTLNKTAVSIMAGASERLTALVAPAAANQSVTWASGNEAVATIAREGNGTVIAVAEGTAEITAATADGKFKATCAVKVEPRVIGVTSVTVVPSSITLLEGATLQMTVVADPPNAPNTSVTWSSSDDSKAAVSPTGRVTAIAEGSAEIIAAIGPASDEIKGICALKVTKPIPVASLTFEPAAITLNAGQERQMVVTVSPANATNKALTWSSSAPDTAAVSATGLVSCLRSGNATITVTSVGSGVTGTCALTVNPAPVTGVRLDKGAVELLPGNTYQLTAAVLPEYAENRGVTWESSASAIVSVNNGLVTAGSAPGSAIITVKTDDGGFTATCKAVVVNELSNVYIAGEMSYYPMPLWGKNYQSQWLSNAYSNYIYGRGLSVFVADDGNAYVTGWDDNTPGYYTQAAVWKNGLAPQYLAQPLGYIYESLGHDVFVSGEDIYVAGWHGDYPYIWINNEPQALPIEGSDGSANSIAVSGGVVYAAGYDYIRGYRNAVAWQKNGTNWTLTNIHPAGAFSSMANSVFVSGNDVYVAGYRAVGFYEHATIWKNGVMQECSPIPGADTTVESVFAANGKVYAAGYASYLDDANGWYYFAAVLWEDGIPRFLCAPDPAYDSQASSVYVYNGIVYASGYIVDYRTSNSWDNMVVWVEGVPQIIAPPSPGYSSYNRANSVFVTNKGIDYVPVTSVGLQSQLALTVGDQHTLEPAVLPVDATNKDVTWRSSNTYVAAVNAATGLISANSAGTAIITATSVDNPGASASCTVTVAAARVPVVSVTLPETLTISMGYTATLQAMVLPAEATNKAVTWSSGNEAVATVNAATGLISSVSIGTAIITATSVDNPSASGSCVVTVAYVPVVSVTLPETMTVNIGRTATIPATVLPAEATNKALYWSSGNVSVATVNAATGLINAISVGTAIITAASLDNSLATDTCAVTVREGGETEIHAVGSNNVSGQTFAAYWKVGDERRLFGQGEIKSIAVAQGGNVYHAGSAINGSASVPVLWEGIGNPAFLDIASINGVEFSNAYATSVAVSAAGDAYVAGHGQYDGYSNRAISWENGILKDLGRGQAFSVVEWQGKPYVAGYELGGPYGYTYYATVWADGVPAHLAEDSPDSAAYSIFVSNGVQYVAGRMAGANWISYATLWIGGKSHQLTTTSYSPANSVYVSGDKAYIAGGLSSSQPVLWVATIIQGEGGLTVGGIETIRLDVPDLLGAGVANSVFVADGVVYVGGAYVREGVSYPGYLTITGNNIELWPVSQDGGVVNGIFVTD